MIAASEGLLNFVSCTWAPVVPEGTVVFGRTDDTNEWDEDGGIVHVVKEEYFLQLEKVENEPCCVTVKLADPLAKITNVSIVTEAKIVEIYGKYGEYIKTCKLEFISDAGDKKIYGTQTNLLTSQEISFKFPGAKEGGILLCGIKILLTEAPSSIPGSIDYNLVDDKLKKSNIPLTEKAEQFKKFLHTYASSKYTNSSHLDPQRFLKIMEGECKCHMRPVELAGWNVSQYISSLIPSAKTNEDERTKGSCKDKTSESAPVVEEKSQNILKEYVDDRMHKLEEKLENNFKKQIEELETRQNEKLDAILALLKNSSLS